MEEQNNQQNKSAAAIREEAVLAFWKESQIFEKSLEKESPKGEYVFYDGPPFGTGLPHYGHLLAGTIKDAFPRYYTMNGYNVRRKWGWDCHGLPVENLIEKELNLNTKKEIEEYGIDKFNQAAKNSVLRYAHEWERIVPKMGRFVDMDDSYKTMDATYTETIWWMFKQLSEKGLIYEGYKTMHLCPRCETTLSNFEVSQGYKDITDISVYVKCELVDQPQTYMLAWTTTPWTLPGNVALAVNEETAYAYVRIINGDSGDALFVCAEERLATVFAGKEYEVIKKVKGSELAGLSYKAPFDYFQKDTTIENHQNGWKVYSAPFVTNDSGTGIVHIASAFGEDDMKLGQEKKLPFVQHVKTNGHFVDQVEHFAGMQVKPKDNHQATDIEIIKYLAHNHLLFEKLKIVHSYPHCWRCSTPLLNYASSSWFVEATKLKEKLLKANSAVEWVPEHVKEGRFGNWLENVRDWAISRSRYWGAPLPVWKGVESGKKYVIGSVDELKSRTKKSGNNYFVMRHGETENNLKSIWSLDKQATDVLTEKGIAKIKEQALTLADKKIDIIIASPFSRTMQTAQIVAETIGLDKNAVEVEDLLSEWNVGNQFNGQSIDSYFEVRNTSNDRYGFKTADGESYVDVLKRVGQFLYNLENKYQGKNILIVSHGAPTRAIELVTNGFVLENLFEQTRNYVNFDNAEIRKIDFTPLPHNENYELDMHRPYIDTVQLVDDDGETLVRVPEVFDCWFESGAMPYAQLHYPFENTELFEKNFPADFIAEGLDQTRGWFYSLMVLGVALFDKSPYKHVVVNGLILAEDGQKMSKSLRNYPDVEPTIDRYGADALRYYILSSPVVKGEELHFSEKELAQVASRVVGRLSNVLSFYELYRNTTIENNASNHQSDNVLDTWILARLSQLLAEVNNGMQSYELDKAVRPIDMFIDDLSTWYLRRSRDRLKDGDTQAIATLYTVLKTTAQVIAPFMPFIAEEIWLKLKHEGEQESVHLTMWPEAQQVAMNVLEEMEQVRIICTEGNMLRKKVAIPVRQPLSKLTVKSEQLAEGYTQIICDELNIKAVVYVTDGEIELDTTITEELKREGNYRELVRALQDLRKESGLTPEDTINLIISENAKALVQEFETDLKKTVQIREIAFVDGSNEIKIDAEVYKVSIEK